MAESVSVKDTLYWNRVAEAALTQEMAFVQLYDAFFPVIYRRLLAKSCNIELTEEAVSRAFVKMYEHLGTFDAGKASFATWLACIADNEMKMLYRGKSYARTEAWPDDFQPPAPTEEEPEVYALRREQQDELKAALADVDQANITVRNFPMSVAELRKRLKLKEGGDVYIFATTISDEGHQLLVCRKKT